MDNKVFNINGATKEQLANAVTCLLFNECGNFIKIASWRFMEDKGLVLYWHVKGENSTPFTDKWGKPKSLEPEELTDILWEWLQSDQAKNFKPVGEWDYNLNHDGSNERGWRLYTEDWGKIKQKVAGSLTYSLCAFVPAYIWHGK